jgi:glycosyltransferase involved in cell wall biosynthesis
MRTCAVVPVFNHERAVGGVVEALLAHELPVLLVDDGSSAECAAVLDALAAAHADRVEVIRHAQNRGKGGAVMTGLEAALQRGYSHALQIDADGQHDTADVPRFLAAAAGEPYAMITGCPDYDESVPLGRKIGRYATHTWVWINTLSLRITDSMCGFRIYPLASTVPVIHRYRIGARMDFDTEILVRLDWAGVPIRNLPTRVRYPVDGVSHFALLSDNLLIARMHARLFFAMLPRAPRLIARHFRSCA